MRKLTFSLIACFALIQTVQAVEPSLTSPMNVSLKHYEAITATLGKNPDFQNIISQGEFIVDLRIQRRRINVNEGEVYVNITTRLPKNNEVVIAKEESLADVKEQVKSTPHRHRGRRHHHWFKNTKTYVAKLMLTPSTDGTTSVSVVSIEPLLRHCQKSSDKENKSSNNRTNMNSGKMN